MYFRSESQDREVPYRIPENYSGHAFPDADAAPEAPLIDEPPPEQTEPPQAERQTPQGRPAVPTFLSSLLPPKPRGGLLGDIGTEELLILGILLLLSQNQSDDDIILLLLLLLLYK
ncbi:MAG: hypothetical protein J6D16_06240 [Clostridia bacterium]|nr:hypothetical protein [Clostridia bacterium]